MKTTASIAGGFAWLFWFCVTAAAAGAAGSLEGLLAQGRTALAENRLAAAERAYRQASEAASGESAEAWLGLGRVLARQERDGEAAEAARAAYELAANRELKIEALNLEGTALFRRAGGKRKKLAPAERALREAVELAGERVTVAHANLAQVLDALGRQPEALELARAVYAGSPDADDRDRSRVLACRLRRELGDKAAGSSAPAGGAEENVEEGAEEGEPAGDEVLTVGEVAAPEAIYAPGVEYPPLARRAAPRGRVVVEAVVDREGCVTEAEVAERLFPVLDRAAVEAIRTWVFRPARLDGEPVAVHYALTVTFGRP